MVLGMRWLTYSFPEGVEYLDFNESLMMESLLVSDDLHGYRLIRLMIKTLQDGEGKRALEDLVGSLGSLVQAAVCREL